MRCKLFISLASICLSAAAASFSQTPVPGKIVDKISASADATQTYAVYLPSTYEQPKKYPIILIFDPFARGAAAVDKYRAAAEKYGYIALGSNNSRNGLDASAMTVVLNSLWSDVNRRFQIDADRVLAAGLSGGARVASLYAYACHGCVFGVIGNGAGFSAGVQVNEKLPFLFFGTIGYNDFNFPEVRTLDRKLTDLKIGHAIATFDGTHQWPPEPVTMDALLWFEIRAMRLGRRSKDDVLIDEALARRSAAASQAVASKRFLDAYTGYASIAEDLAQWRDVSEFERKTKELLASSEFRQEQKSEDEQFRNQQRYASELIDIGSGLRDPETRAERRRAIRRKVGDLRKDSEATNDTPARRTARRALDQVFVETVEAASFRYERAGQFDVALDNLELAGEIAPNNAQVHYDRARLLAMQGEKKKAVEELTKAIELGLRDAGRIRTEKSFETLQKDQAFVELLKRIGQ